MPNMTLSEMEILVARKMGIYDSITVTADGAADGLDLYSTGLCAYADNSLFNKWARVTQSTTVVVLQIAENWRELGQLKFYKPFGAKIVATSTVEIFNYNPEDMDRCINEAIEMCFPELCMPVQDKTTPVSNCLRNNSFELWSQSSYPDYWALTAGTVTASTVRHNTGSYGMCLSGTCAVQQSSLTYPDLQDFRGNTLTVYGYGKSSVALDLYITIRYVVRATTTNTTVYHTGGGAWELMTNSVAIPSNASSITIIVGQVTVGSTGYMDDMYVPSDNIYTLAPPMVRKVERVEIGDEWTNPLDTSWYTADFEEGWINGMRYIMPVNYNWPDHRMRVAGRGTFGQFTTLASILNIDTDWKWVIVYGAVYLLLTQVTFAISSNDAAQAKAVSDIFFKKYDQLKAKACMVPFAWQSRTKSFEIFNER